MTCDPQCDLFLNKVALVSWLMGKKELFEEEGEQGRGGECGGGQPGLAGDCLVRVVPRHTGGWVITGLWSFVIGHKVGVHPVSAKMADVEAL